MSYYQQQNIRNEFADRLKNAINNSKLSKYNQTQLANNFSVTRQAITAWLDGIAMPNQARMPIIAKKLGVSLGWLRDGTGPMYDMMIEVDNKNIESISVKEYVLLRHYRLLDNENRQIIQKLCQKLN
jgi:transcriptional regulator with XRE-family HTH domain